MSVSESYYSYIRKFTGTSGPNPVGKESRMTMELDAPTPTTLSQSLHPLDPLSAAEITAAVAILRASGKLGSHVRVATGVLQEPSKEIVLNFKDGDPIEREAFAIILDNDDGATYEAVVSITSSTLKG